jgi:hypothetical protein
MVARERIPAQTVAPKFTGRFNKGMDYFGEVDQFEKEFAEDLAVIAFAIREFGLPGTLKLSVHSGSDKFSLYLIINRLIKERGAALHVKTCGTTWLEEIVGLAEGSITARGQMILGHTSIGRFGKETELVGAAVFLASERASSFITGIDFRVDGGFLSQTI